MPRRLLNVGCGTHYAEGWVNTDTWLSKETQPDVLVDAHDSYPFESDYFDAIYLGHVLEHIAYPLVPNFLRDMARIARPGAQGLVVGPDVWRTIHRWRNDDEPWHMVESTLEHQDTNFQPGREHQIWAGAAHHWNCHEERVVELLQGVGFTMIRSVFDEIPNDPAGTSWYDSSADLTWPVVGKKFWQLCLRFEFSKKE